MHVDVVTISFRITPIIAPPDVQFQNFSWLKSLQSFHFAPFVGVSRQRTVAYMI